MSDIIYPRDNFGFTAATYWAVAEEACRPSFLGTLLPAGDPTSTVVVIGAGYTGLSAALHLATLDRELGTQRRIIVVDEKKIGAGPSGNSGGHLGGLQASDDDVMKHCGEALGSQLIDAANRGQELVKSLIQKYNIDCDLRDGYITIDNEGGRSRGDGFQIDPYPYVLGLAEAARNAGVEIYENVRVNKIGDTEQGCSILVSRENSTSQVTISAAYVIAAGGHRMGETIPTFQRQREKTVELYLTTIATAPLPLSVIKAIMPEANGERLPFCDSTEAIGYGGIDRSGVLTFGTSAKGYQAAQSIDHLKSRLTEIFPDLERAYRDATCMSLEYQHGAVAIPTNFTRSFLPAVGEEGRHKRILSAHGLGGQGIAVGTMLGATLADEVDRRSRKELVPNETFKNFAAITHTSSPLLKLKPFRVAVAQGIGVWGYELKDHTARLRRRLSKNFKPSPD